MKKVIFSLALLLTCSLLGYAQKGISYQAVILDPKPIEIPGQEITGQPFVNGEVSLKFKLFSSTFVQEFEEVHVAKTDAYGLVNVLIGSQNAGAFSALVWDLNPRSMQVWVSFDQGGTYTKVSDQVLSYNPYSIYAETAGKLGGTLGIAAGGTGATTAAAARTNLGLGNVDNTADANKPISTATQAALDTKANANDVTTALATKANAAEVATALGTKANESEVTTRLATKANASEVTTALATKANANEVSTALASKASAEEVATALATKANANEVSTALASKASAEEVATALATKANASDVTTSLATKANADEVITALATKANASEVSTALATKASAAEVTSALATKANASDVTASLGLKEDVSNKANTSLGSSTTFYPTQNAVKTYVDAQVAAATIGDANGSTKGKIQLAGDLGGTAAAPTVPGLALKANTTDVNSSLALKAPIASPSFTGSVAVGTASPSASAVLDINSTSQGMLVPRMTTTDRNAIVNPANALLIFNTSNNTFEVFKSTCSCWVTMNDNGNTAAANLVNTAPTASSLNYIGTFRAGGTATIVYTYYDAQVDAQGATTLQWEIANDNTGTSKTNLSTGASVTFGPSHVGRYVRIKLTPRAATGILNGIANYGEWKLISAGTVPYGSSLSIIGAVAQGSLLTGTYTFNGGSGVENSLGSEYNWQSATNNVGLNIQNMAIPETTPPQTIPAHTTTIRPLSTEIGKYIRFGVKARDNASFSATDFVYSNWVGPVTLAVEAAPVAKNVNFSPANPGTNVLLTANYSFEDANEDPEGSTLFQWYTADDATGTNQTAITGATASTFTLTDAQANKFIGVGITPKAATGATTGTQVVYYDPSASIGLASFTITGATQKSNNFYTNRVMNATDEISININVTTGGSIAFSTTTVNGYSFSKAGTFAKGVHNVLLTANGTQTAFNTGGDAFTITGVGTTTQTTTLTVSNVKIGSDFTTHYNGISAGISSNFLQATYTTGETFNNNSTCFSKPVSTSSCVGSTLTIGSNSYAIANINGQCWMTQNLKELPNGVAITANQWLATSPGDKGFYGYFNTITTGASGWATTEPAANEGLLYQWSAAMLGSTTERAQGICPTGWHIPSDCEWIYLEHGIGMSLSEQNLIALRADNADNQGTPGYKLRSAGVGKTNASGFSALVNGYRIADGTFVNSGTFSAFWTSSAVSAIDVTNRYLWSGKRGVGRGSDKKSLALNVRCLKD